MKKLLYIVIVLPIFSCTDKTETEKKLFSNKTIVSIFNKSEIKDLAVIIDFFNKRICTEEQLEKNNIIACYQRYFDDFEEAMTTSFWDMKIPFEEQLKLYREIDENTFNQIWAISEMKPRQYPFSLKSICLNWFGKYYDFLKEYGKECTIIKDLYDVYRAFGDVSVGSSVMSMI